MKASYAIVITLYCAAIFWFSHQSSPPDPFPKPPGADKVKHAALYAGLALLVAAGRRNALLPVKRVSPFWFPLLFALAYGISDEIHQIFVPDRTFDLLDIAADGLGPLVALLIARRWWNRPGPRDLVEQ